MFPGWLKQGKCFFSSWQNQEIMFWEQSAMHAHVHKLINIASMGAELGNMFWRQNLCQGSKNVFGLRQKYFLILKSKMCFCNIMLTLWGNWATFASTTMFLSLARPLVENARTERWSDSVQAIHDTSDNVSHDINAYC